MRSVQRSRALEGKQDDRLGLAIGKGSVSAQCAKEGFKGDTTTDLDLQWERNQ